MISEEKIQEINKRLKRGEPEGEIKERLRSDGYSEENIKKAFVPRQYDMGSWYLTFAIMVSLGGLLIFAEMEVYYFLAWEDYFS